MIQQRKLEIGSGNKPKEGYLHFDIRSNVKADVVGDAKKLPFKENEFSEVYSRFFLEHLSRKEAKLALREMLRVLKKGGVLEIIVPNLAYFCKLFVEEKGQKKEWALNKIYGFEEYKEDHHFFGYDEETLAEMLKDAGLIEIIRVKEEEQYLHLKAKKP
jgi:predicted SAM-dependent methyltransferase